MGGVEETQPVIHYLVNGAEKGDGIHMFRYAWDKQRIQTAVIGTAQRGAKVDVVLDRKEIYGETNAQLAVSRIYGMMLRTEHCEAGGRLNAFANQGKPIGPI